MSTLTTDRLKYAGEYRELTYSFQKKGRSKGIGDILCICSPILWIFFFLMLTVLVNVLGG